MAFCFGATLVSWLEYRTKATFVGEPTGGRPNHPGDAEAVVLPNSRMRVRISRIFWEHSLPEDDRPWHAPDVPVQFTYDHYRSQRDPALETILEHTPKPFPDVHWPPERIRRLAGEYEFGGGKKLSLRAEGGRLMASVDGFLQFDLHPAGADTLLTDREGISMSVSREPKVRVEGLLLHVHGKTRVLKRR